MLGPFPVGLDPKILTLRAGAPLLELDGQPGITFAQGRPLSHYTYRTGGVTYRVVDVPTGGVHHLWLAHPDDVMAMEPVPMPDCSDLQLRIAKAIDLLNG